MSLRDHSYACIFIHLGVGHTDKQTVQHFDLKKLSQICCVLLMGFKPRVFGSQVRCSQAEVMSQMSG